MKDIRVFLAFLVFALSSYTGANPAAYLMGPRHHFPGSVKSSPDYQLVKASAKTDKSPDCTSSYYEMQKSLNAYKKDVALTVGSVIGIFLAPPPGDIIAAFAFLGSVFDLVGNKLDLEQKSYNYYACMDGRLDEVK